MEQKNDLNQPGVKLESLINALTSMRDSCMQLSFSLREYRCLLEEQEIQAIELLAGEIIQKAKRSAK